MTTPFLGELKLVSFAFPPKGWALCHGQILPIAQNQALFALLGTTYGGNGQTTFRLPDLRGRSPMHTGIGVALGAYATAYASGLAVLAAMGRSADTSPLVPSALVSGAMVAVLGGLTGLLRRG